MSKAASSFANRTLAIRFGGQYNRLMRNLALLILLIFILMSAAVVYYDEKQIGMLSRELITTTVNAMHKELGYFFGDVVTDLEIAVDQLQLLDPEDEDILDTLYYRLSPFLTRTRNTSGILLADVESHNEVFLMMQERDRKDVLVRLHFPAAEGEDTLRFQRWLGDEMVEEWSRNIPYDPGERSWFQNALDAGEGEVVATEPHMFFTNPTPGITISKRWTKQDIGREFVIGFDVVLAFLADFTQDLAPTPNSVVIVTDSEVRLLGLPRDTHFDTDIEKQAALLQPIADLDVPLLNAALTAWHDAGAPTPPYITTFEFDGERWWMGAEPPAQAAIYGEMYTTLIMPEKDFAAGLSAQRNLVLAGIGGLGAVLALVVTAGGMRRMRREMREASLRSGQVVGPFELLYKIGGGSTGDVYRARHALLQRPSAVKLMRAEFTRSEAAKERFLREVRITSSLANPNTVEVYDFGETDEGNLFYAMELLTGFDLEKLVQTYGAQTPGRVIHVLNGICGSLAEAHQRSLIHRDIKPANVMLCERGGAYDVVKVLDFGLVKDIEDTGPGLTQMDVIVGTPYYMAPEMIADRSAYSVAGDLYAVGALGYFLLTGQHVFDGSSTVEICSKHLHEAPIRPSERLGSECPADLEGLLLLCLEKDPAKRPQSAADVRTGLRHCADYGRWTMEQAEQWWSANQGELSMQDVQSTRAPLGDTRELIRPQRIKASNPHRSDSR